VHDVIDLERYPIDDPELMAELHRQVRRDGVCELPGFVRAEAVAEAVTEALILSERWFATDEQHTVYFEPVDLSAAPDDPRGIRLRSAKKQIAYDQIPNDSGVRRMYQNELMTRFVAGVLGMQQLHPLDDPLAALGYAYMERGDTLAWHFDRSEFAVTLMLQPAERGGAFEYVTDVRSEDDERPQLVAAVLDGDRSQVISLEPAAGTLTVFRGHRSLHRVSPVEGDRVRVNAVLAYGDRPGMRLNELTQRLFYGRVA
jgi:2OG-Fe(II) oxygenase superfamily